MAEREFKIKITGDASGITASSKQAAGAMEEVGQVSQKTGQKHEEHSKYAHLLANEHRSIHQAMHLVTAEAPVMQVALQAAIAPQRGNSRASRQFWNSASHIYGFSLQRIPMPI